MTQIAFIGLGNMGAPMARNLLKHQQQVIVFDLVPAAVDALVKAGATRANSPQQAVATADVVITMLPTANHVKSLYLGDEGLLTNVPAHCLLIDCSTIDSGSAIEVGQQARKMGLAFIDAPVSGGVGGAAAGTLTFIMGGDTADVERARPILALMGANLFHAGALGAGQIAKVCNNMLLSVLMAGTSEALQLAIANGLDPKVMSDIMLQSSGCNWSLQKYNPCPGVMDNVPSSNDYNGGFMVKLMNKDLTLAMDTAAKVGAATPMASAAQALYRLHQAQQSGNGEKDFSSIFTLFAKH
ncbi:3-hydroxyisobutyrate dehydrogenase [Alteromonas lipolytica]|uniref:3-hydroxyisobutyrate dehydrogenase n=1 Tax=Alteromonas lipolytica TaxID=1856405 RepID=A0A1E8FGN5_9ALTE|nr:3-hydroxyisobutyrate dehydrogenase [Alteromonas lipolytica]OFI35105.1 3-hydroxyisobutyrate dehydrogenase [Alteromonas lipolytica]GGF56725.1 3-hydroxyisobutyrate dehydrogenase [Alteromonas lipolytica]